MTKPKMTHEYFKMATPVIQKPARVIPKAAPVIPRPAPVIQKPAPVVPQSKTFLGREGKKIVCKSCDGFRSVEVIRRKDHRRICEKCSQPLDAPGTIWIVSVGRVVVLGSQAK